MSNLRTVYRPPRVFSSLMCSSRLLHLHQARSRSSSFPPWFNLSRNLSRKEPWFRVNQRRTAVKASNWSDQKSPYETLELERDADEEQIKSAYRRLAKFYHPDDPDEERKIFAKEKKASIEQFNNTLKRHTLVLKKRDLMRKKAEEEKKKVISQLLAAEGLELDDTDDDSQ